MKKTIILAITGASGAIYGIKMLEFLVEMKIEVHLLISKAAQVTIASETDYDIKSIRSMANYYYKNDDIGARIASGSFKTDAMIIAPCSIKTMSSIATGNCSDLISRAADVILKERRKLIIMLRETPLHSGHLENMLRLSNIGAIIAPPVPAFYNRPETIDDIINHTVGRILDQVDIEHKLFDRWNGVKNKKELMKF